MTPSSFLAPWPRLRRCCRAALLALAALLAVPVAAAAADEARLGEMLLAIEHDGRADPLSAARRLEAAPDRARVKTAAPKFDDAVRLGQEALALADRLGIGWWQSDARSNLAYSYYQAGQLEQAERLNAEARVLAEKLGDAMSLFNAATNAGILAAARHDATGEEREMRAAIDYARRAGARRDEALALANLADVYLRSRQYATALAV